jgi:hypothetical protein
MGVTAARAAGLRATRTATRLDPRRPAPRLSVRPFSTGRTGGRRALPPAAAMSGPRTFWDRMQDDGDLIRLKIVLLTTLALLTAILEWVA